jgi:ApbE superfamily uncharacterized protein (UPF0280 family)
MCDVASVAVGVARISRRAILVGRSFTPINIAQFSASRTHSVSYGIARGPAVVMFAKRVSRAVAQILLNSRHNWTLLVTAIRSTACQRSLC